MEWVLWMIAVAVLGLAAVAASGRLGELPGTVSARGPGGSVSGVDTTVSAGVNPGAADVVSEPSGGTSGASGGRYVREGAASSCRASRSSRPSTWSIE